MLLFIYKIYINDGNKYKITIQQLLYQTKVDELV